MFNFDSILEITVLTAEEKNKLPEEILENGAIDFWCRPSLGPVRKYGDCRDSRQDVTTRKYVRPVIRVDLGSMAEMIEVGQPLNFIEEDWDVIDIKGTVATLLYCGDIGKAAYNIIPLDYVDKAGRVKAEYANKNYVRFEGSTLQRTVIDWLENKIELIKEDIADDRAYYSGECA